MKKIVAVLGSAVLLGALVTGCKSGGGCAYDRLAVATMEGLGGGKSVTAAGFTTGKYKSKSSSGHRKSKKHKHGDYDFDCD